MPAPNRRSIGRVYVGAQNLSITYEIPGVNQEGAKIAGGFIWFNASDRELFHVARVFHLETESGNKVRGSIVQIHQAWASVVVEV